MKQRINLLNKIVNKTLKNTFKTSESCTYEVLKISEQSLKTYFSGDGIK